MANNAGGPHCLAYGVTSAHVVALEVVLPDGSVVVLGDELCDATGYDLRGVFVGSEGTFGIATRIAVRLTPDPPAVRTLLLDFMDIADAAETVSAIIAAGVVPAAMEMMDQGVVAAVEPFVGAGYPLDAEALLIVELDGPAVEVEYLVKRVQDLARGAGADYTRISQNDEERERFWAGRKNAFPAIGRISPDYMCMDGTIPRHRMPEVLRRTAQMSARRSGVIKRRRRITASKGPWT